MKNTKVEQAGCASLIVPIYNSQEGLRRCLNAVSKQTYHNMQVILIDDGSIDESLQICYEYAKVDARFEVYHIENGGVSHARNYGLSKVKGEFVLFLDSDDMIRLNFVEIMVEQLSKNVVDLVVCGYYKEFKKNIRIPVERLEVAGCYTAKEYLRNTLKDPGHHYYGVVWNKIYRADILRDNDIHFDVNVNLGEDFIFNLSYLLCISKVKVIRSGLIFYNKRNARTLSQNKSKSLKDCMVELNNRKKIYRKYVDTFKRAKLYDECIEDINFYWIIFYVRQVHDTAIEYKWSEEEKKDWIYYIEKEEYISESLKIVPKKRIDTYQKWYTRNYNLKRFVKQLGGIK